MIDRLNLKRCLLLNLLWSCRKRHVLCRNLSRLKRNFEALGGFALLTDLSGFTQFWDLGDILCYEVVSFWLWGLNKCFCRHRSNFLLCLVWFQVNHRVLHWNYLRHYCWQRPFECFFRHMWFQNQFLFCDKWELGVDYQTCSTALRDWTFNSTVFYCLCCGGLFRFHRGDGAASHVKLLKS